LELKLGAAKDRRGRGKRAPQRKGDQQKRAGGGRSLHEAAAGERRVGDNHCLAPAGVIARISYMPPGCCSIVKFTRVPGLMALRSTAGATGNSMVIAGQPISGIGWWLRLTLCCAGSTEFTVPVPWASLWPARALCISLCSGDGACAWACMG